MATQSGQLKIPMFTPKAIEKELESYKKGWVRIGHRLAGCHERNQWELGAWLIEGRQYLSNAYDEAEKITGLARATLLDIKGTAECFDGTSRCREDRLSWSHHKELKKLKDNEQFLREMSESAVEKGWSVGMLRDNIKKKLNSGKPSATTRSISIEASLFGRLEIRAAQQEIGIKKLVAVALCAYLDQKSEAGAVEQLVAS
jgi:hypothetical protein